MNAVIVHRETGRQKKGAARRPPLSQLQLAEGDYFFFFFCLHFWLEDALSVSPL